MSLNYLKQGSPSRRSQQGSMLVVAIFVLTVMIFLAVGLQAIFNNAGKAFAYEVFGTRALSAANSGAEIALQRIFNSQAGQAALVYNAQGVVTLTLDPFDSAAKSAFHGCTVAVTITKFQINEANLGYNYIHYRVESTATCEAGDFKTVRTVAVEGRER